MKKIYLLVFVCLFISLNKIEAQYVAIPDAHFVTWLSTHGYSGCLNGNQLDTTCSAVLNATYVNCYGNNITDLTGIQYFKNLDTLNCSYNLLQSIPDLSDSMTWLDVSYQFRRFSIYHLPPYLKYFSCSSDSVSSLPAFPNSLKTIYCDQNFLTSLLNLPDSLQQLNCWRNLLVTLPALPPNLKYLDCNSNQITILPQLPTSLITLNCELNQLTGLPPLPSQLYQLDFGDTLMNSFGPFPPSLNRMGVSDLVYNTIPFAIPSSIYFLNISYAHNLDSIPALPPHLGTLQIFNCPSLRSLPSLPSTLGTLLLQDVAVRTLPNMPPHLYELQCYSDSIVFLPALPSYYMNELVIYHCPYFSALPELPTTLNVLNLNTLPLLTCLPELTNIGELDLWSTPITCVPNRGIIGTYAGTNVNTLPLCYPSNSQGCQSYWNVAGQVYDDQNLNCIWNNEIPVSRIKLDLTQSGNIVKQTFSTDAGQYTFKTPAFGNYEVSVDTTGLPIVLFCPASNLLLDTISAIDSLKTGQDFAFTCPTGFDLGVSNIVSSAYAPDLDAVVNIAAGDMAGFYGMHCTNGVSGTVTAVISGPVTYVGSNGWITPTVSGDTVTWTISNFNNVDVNSSFGLKLHTNYNAQGGSQVCITVTITPGNDNNPANNTLTQCYTTLAAWDPNHKDVSPGGNIDTAQKWMTYTVHFQNTGTYYARNIRVDDTLDINKFDISSVQLLAYSFPPVTEIESNGAMHFNFYGNGLPDSTMDFDASQGYVQYKVKLKDGLPVGTQIQNTANIYFDFNPAVVTNTATNTISLHVVTANAEISDNLNLRLYPNPTTGTLHLQADGFTPDVITIYDLSGQKLREEKYYPTINIQTLSTGFYFIEVRAGENVVRKRFVKM